MRQFRADYSSRVCIGLEDEEWRRQNVKGHVASSARLLTIRYLGVWDTVRALGVLDGARALFAPLPFLQSSRYTFHDTTLTNFVESARHAVAIDERRGMFPVLPFGDLAALNREKEGFLP
jgi:uncharacterized protein (DUF2235 family)